MEGKDLSNEEMQIIRDAMIENPKFTFVCSEQLIEQLFITFESIGYRRDKDLRYGPLIPNLMGCVFVGEKPNHKGVA